MAGALWLLTMMITGRGSSTMLVPFAVLVAGTVGGPLLAWGCRAAARGPARTYGLEEERKLRESAAACGRTRVLEPVAAELMRYREVREQYAIAAGAVGRGADGAGGAPGTMSTLDTLDAAAVLGPADAMDAMDPADALDAIDLADGGAPVGVGHSRE
ncbi:hypothetical protein [Streptomyces sp. NBC_01186]|uniref:hypothetical protein n=1 Tax=Streptomyces sp. NBC_01186 TaxID=2903765 RepID=UPI003FA71F13